MKITTIGLDLAKSVFQVHAVDASSQVVVRNSLRRSHRVSLCYSFFESLPYGRLGRSCGKGGRRPATPRRCHSFRTWESADTYHRTVV